MWLLDVKTIELHEFLGENIPTYMILSHRWGAEEVSFVEMRKAKHRTVAQRKAGFEKIQKCCFQAHKDGYDWAWIDSCCIDKRSSAELSEAINSMFRWYRLSDRCYVYLADVSSEKSGIQRIGDSQWFTRGWTLQELLAPKTIVFFAQDWVAIGYISRKIHSADVVAVEPHATFRYPEASSSFPCTNFAVAISAITGVPLEVLTGEKGLWQACVAQRMFWASRRRTAREEDRAYSLMGLFDVKMPILYGEGLENAFTRLQHEIMRKSTDQSILAWYRTDTISYRLFADSPDCFLNSGNITLGGAQALLPTGELMKWSSSYMTNIGLRITLPIVKMTDRETFSSGERAHALLNCLMHEGNGVLRRICLNILWLNASLEGEPIFTCYRPSTFTPVGAGEGLPTCIYLCGNDYRKSRGRH